MGGADLLQHKSRNEWKGITTIVVIFYNLNVLLYKWKFLKDEISINFVAEAFSTKYNHKQSMEYVMEGM